MLVWAVWVHTHEDEKYHFDSYSDVDSVFTDKLEAYTYAMKYNLKHLAQFDCHHVDHIRQMKSPFNQLEYLRTNLDQFFGKPEYSAEPTYELWNVRELSLK